MSLLQHPFTTFGGIGVYAETPLMGKRRVPTAAACRFPVYGEAVPKGLKGLFHLDPFWWKPCFTKMDDQA